MQLSKEQIKQAKLKYQDYRANCRKRINKFNLTIEFRLTYDEWIDIWLTSGHWHERGMARNQYVMSLINNKGNYEVGNLQINLGKDATLKSINSPEYQASRQAMLRSPEYQANQKIAMEKLHQDPVYIAKKTLAVQKACSKQISCDGVIYSSGRAAALALAPVNVICKVDWLKKQMKIYPEKYFYTK